MCFLVSYLFYTIFVYFFLFAELFLNYYLSCFGWQLIFFDIFCFTFLCDICIVFFLLFSTFLLLSLVGCWFSDIYLVLVVCRGFFFKGFQIWIKYWLQELKKMLTCNKLVYLFFCKKEKPHKNSQIKNRHPKTLLACI